MSADRASAGPLMGYQLGAPAGWGVLPSEPVDGPDPGPPRRAVAALAAELTTDGEAASRCEQLLLLAQPALVAEPHLAVWVADPLVGDPTGLLVVTHVTDDDAGVALPETYHASLESFGAGPGLQRRAVDRTRVGAGEAVVVNDLARDASGRLEETVTYMVFPDGCRDAVDLTFATSQLHLSPEMFSDARAIADALTVTARSA